MVRKRKGGSGGTNRTVTNSPGIYSSNSSSSMGSRQPTKQTKSASSSKFVMTQARFLVGCIFLAIAGYFGYVGYLETRVNTPYNINKVVEKSGLEDPDRYWGSYRPGSYFGLKTRDSQSLVTGLMWYEPKRLHRGDRSVRHWCEIGDNLDKYGWVAHDGRTFGVQEILDFPYKLDTSFIKFPGGSHGGHWTARISVTSSDMDIKEEQNIALIWYMALDSKTNGNLKPFNDRSTQTIGIEGETTGLGEFKLSYTNSSGTIIHYSFLSTVVSGLDELQKTVMSQLHLAHDKKTNQRLIVLPGEILAKQGDKTQTPNFIASHFTVKVPFTLDIVYRSLSGTEVVQPGSIIGPVNGLDYTNMLKNRLDYFNDRFEKTFKLREKGYGVSEIEMAQSALSNMIGGIGYFYGTSRVQGAYTKEPVSYWKAPLYTAVPSRSFFPRGFLWDEGFHGLLISSWDLDIELDIISHWFDLMNSQGWIPREQILGEEALAKVPEEFVTQHDSNANPPTFFITLKRLLDRHRKELMTKSRQKLLKRLYPRLQAWFSWYNRTQQGEILGTYRWRGRDEKTILELNPKTLTSGLDDYPRASHPTDDERHVDLRCWMAYAAGVMNELSYLLSENGDKYWETFYYLTDNSVLEKYHYSPLTGTYADWGLHTDSVILKRKPSPQVDPHHPQYQMNQGPMIRVVTKHPQKRFIDANFGYINMFPFFLGILSSESVHLGKILRDMRDPEQVWTDFGLRSLSKKSPFYMKRNTEHDPPYWRGQIWINMNYLALKALYSYSELPGPYKDEARKIYGELRKNVVNNILREYKRTGFLWEQYNDKTGYGSGCKPFTGWSALVVLIMSEQY